MKKLKLALAASTAVLGLGAASSAFAGDGPTVAWNIGGATDYLFRGLDQTGPFSEGQAFGGVDVSQGMVYGGVWLSNTGSGGKGFEYDLYAGVKPVVGPVTFDFGAIYYGYTDDNVGFSSSDANMWEVKAAATYASGPGSLGAAVYYSPNFAGKFNGDNGDSSVYGEINASYTFSNKAVLSGAVGEQWVDDNVYSVDGYTTWNVGVTYPITDHVSIDGRYIGTNDDASAVGFAGNTAVATLKATF